ncbi:MAG: Flagellar assembly factor FliW [Cryobacterium sp.]|jgi:flagellar assembly factor FliW|nr:Flagellar assembly factor FliW [Cryobacterium sp.]
MSAALTFVTPPPGFAPLTNFTLNAVEGAHGLYALVATASENVRLFVVDAGVHLPEYTPVITDEQAGSLDLVTSDEALVLVVANPGEAGTTVNLMAPIVVNSSTGASAQLILDGQDWPLRAELAAARA